MLSSLLFYGQMVGWREIRIYPKFSFSRSNMAHLLCFGWWIDTRNSKRTTMDKRIGLALTWIGYSLPEVVESGSRFGQNNMEIRARFENQSRRLCTHPAIYFSVDFDLTSIQTVQSLWTGWSICEHNKTTSRQPLNSARMVRKGHFGFCYGCALNSPCWFLVVLHVVIAITTTMDLTAIMRKYARWNQKSKLPNTMDRSID